MEYDEEPKLLAIDCEMCAAAGDDKALLSLCMVDTDGTSIIHVSSQLLPPPPLPSRPGPIDRPLGPGSQCCLLCPSPRTVGCQVSRRESAA